MNTTYIVHRKRQGSLDVFGPTIEFLTLPEEMDGSYCVMMGTIPAGVSVPLHSHPDLESFFLISGTVDALSHDGEKFEWLAVKPGEFVHVPSNAKHAWRNISSEPALQLITTTPKLGRFFQEIGRPVTPGVPLPPPTPGALQLFLRVAAKYGYWLGSPAENAAIGITLFEDTRALLS
jgi:quercetin dioxygenase-like cupin family protein